MKDVSFYKEKLSQIQTLLPSETKLLIVSKHRSVEEIQAYYNLGHRDFGENRVQELLEKAEQLNSRCPEIRWHMIGHLQSNKLNQLLSVSNLVSVHSIHSEELLQKILSKDSTLSHRIGLFLQVNTSREEEKSGFESFDQMITSIKSFKESSNFYLQGLMTMGKIRTTELSKDAEICFKNLNLIKEKAESLIQAQLETSMGMSQDFEIAIKEKSSWIRLGTMMFE